MSDLPIHAHVSLTNPGHGTEYSLPHVAQGRQGGA